MPNNLAGHTLFNVINYIYIQYNCTANKRRKLYQNAAISVNSPRSKRRRKRSPARGAVGLILPRFTNSRNSLGGALHDSDSPRQVRRLAGSVLSDLGRSTLSSGAAPALGRGARVDIR